MRFVTCIVVGLLLAVTGAIPGWALAPSHQAFGQSKLQAILEQRTGRYGISVIDLQSGEQWGIGEDEVFHGASTFKVPLNLYLYERIAAGQVDPETRLTQLAQDYEGGTGILQYRETGKQYSLAELSRLSIVYSDNVATRMLMRYLGTPNVKRYMREVGGTTVDDLKNITTPRDAALYMQTLVSFCTSHPVEGTSLMHNLQNTVFNERIPKLLPKGVKVAHKIGNWPATGSYHDVGYVEHPQRPYVIAVFSKNASRSVGYQTIAQVSRTVYDHQSSLTSIRFAQNDAVITGFIDNSHRTQTGLREFAEALGATVDWNKEANTVTIDHEAKIVFRIGEQGFSVDDRVLTMDTVPVLSGGRVFVPLRYAAEALGATVEWDSSSNAISVNTSTSPS